MAQVLRGKVKPAPWRASRHRVHPKWGWFWQDLILGVPMWHADHDRVQAFGEPDPFTSSSDMVGVISGNVAWSDGMFGRQVDMIDSETAGALEWQDGIWRPALEDNLAFTVIAVFNVQEIGTDERSLWTKYNSGGGATTSRALNWYISATGTVLFAVNNFSTVLETTATVTAGTWYMAVATQDQGPNVSRQWLYNLETGDLVERQAGTYVNITHSASQPIRMGSRYSAGGDNFRGSFAMGALLRRSVGDSEVNQLACDPFGPWRKPSIKAVVVPAVVSGSAPIYVHHLNQMRQ